MGRLVRQPDGTFQKYCSRCHLIKTLDQFNRRSSSPDGHSATCRDCDIAWREAAKAKKAKRAAELRAAYHGTTYSPPVYADASPSEALRQTVAEGLEALDREVEQVIESATPEPEPELERTTPDEDYIPPTEVLATWAADQLAVADGEPASNFLFSGPSGSGKTECARALARLADLPFVKVDAPSMTDPEAWFGTREVVVEDGAPRTVFVESEFAHWVQKPCVLLIDEGNRIADAVRGILLPLFDDSRAVTNPLTGETIHRHPACAIIMTANIGLAFTGTFAIDPAFLTRSLTTKFNYLTPVEETLLARTRTGCDSKTAQLFVRFANETRERARSNEDFPPISTREVLKACRLVKRGLDPQLAAQQTVLNAASDEGGGDSLKAQLERIWGGIYVA